jgi:hypothetical protein
MSMNTDLDLDSIRQKALDVAMRIRAELEVEGNTPLHRAASNGELELCKKLLAEGADPNARNALGQTPMEYRQYWWDKFLDIAKADSSNDLDSKSIQKQRVRDAARGTKALQKVFRVSGAARPSFWQRLLSLFGK